MKRWLYVPVVAGLASSLAAAAEPSSNPSVKFIQRTMRSLAGEIRPGEKIRILFYGQSITAQAWSHKVAANLKKQYPEANLEIKNKAIGGFQSPALRRTAYHDLYPFYPDLLIFHVYGDLENYEATIRKVRETTTAEIVLWTDHVANPKRMGRDDQHSSGIRELAAKYGCMLIDVRKQWKEHLADSGKTPADFLRDSVHLNAEGDKLLAKIVTAELVRTDEYGGDPKSDAQIVDIPATAAAVKRGNDGALSVTFTGNRLVAISDGKNPEGTLDVTLDGRELKTFPGAWAATRPSKSVIWMPAIRQVTVAADPVAEKWTLTCLDDSMPDGTKIHFKLAGSVTGNDGEGWSTEDFVSTSGTIRIAKRDWGMAFPLKYRKMTLPKGFTVKWKTYPMFADTFAPGPKGTETVLLQGVDNAEHTLTIKREAGGGELGIGKLKVYCPRQEQE